MEAHVRELEASLTEAQQKLTEALAGSAVMAGQITALNGQITSLTAQINDLQKKLADATKPPVVVPPVTTPTIPDAIKVIAKIDNAKLREISGLAASIKFPGILWTHNDGNSHLFAIDAATGAIKAELTVTGLTGVDMEAIGVGRSTDGTPVIWVCDAGDNSSNRPAVQLYRIPEPAELKDQTVKIAKTLTVTYEDGPRDCEAFIVDQKPAGNFWLITKEKDPKFGGIYAVPYEGGVAKRLKGDVRQWITDATLSPDATKLVIRAGDAGSIYAWPYDASTRKDFKFPAQVQGEAVGFADDGKSVYIATEGIGDLIQVPLSTLPAVGTSTTTPTVPAPTPDPVPAAKTELGANVHFAWEENKDAAKRKVTLDMLQQAGIKKVRFDVAWASLEPTTQGTWNEAYFTKMNTWINEFKSHGMKAMVTMMWAPKWATGQADANGDAVKNAVVFPQFYAAFGRAAGEVAARWKDDIDLIELWNEPDLSTFWSTKDPVTFLAMMKAAYPIAKKASPTTQFMAAAPTYLGLASNWYTNMYKGGFKNGVTHDVVGIHPYLSPGDAAPGSLSDNWSILGISKLRDMMTAYGDKSDLIATEFGWSDHTNEMYDRAKEPWNMGVTPAQQAQFLTDAMPLLKAQGVKTAYWYMDRETNQSDIQQRRFGMLAQDGSAKPVYAAAKAFTGK
jgi:hypothetical protein